MMTGVLPDTVRQFILKHIGSVPELELLLLLHADRGLELGVEEAAARLYVDDYRARQIFEALERHQLLVGAGEPRRWRYVPPDAAAERAVFEVAQAYRTHLIPLANLIHSKASGSVQEFARAFDFKKER